MRSTCLISNKRLVGRVALAAMVALLGATAWPVYAQVKITCPPDLTVSNDPGVCSAVVDFGAPVVTGTNGSEAVTVTPASGSTFPVGTNEVEATVAVGTNVVASCNFTVVVEDTEPPAITNVWASKTMLWPPNHKMVKVTVYYQVSDNCDTNPVTRLSVTSNEAVDAKGSGKTKPDWQVVDAHHVLLRAERAGSGNGRIYTITITATDDSRNASTAEVTVTVPHDRGKGDRGKGHGKG